MRLNNCFPGDNDMICCQHDNGNWICFPNGNKEKTPKGKEGEISKQSTKNNNNNNK